MKKIFGSICAIILAVTFAAFFQQETYAEEVQVNFKITNHKAEITARNDAAGKDLKPGDTIPDTVVSYKNAVRATYSILKDGTAIKSDSYDLDLANEFKTLLIDLSDVESEVGDYTIKVAGYNVDGDITNADDINFSVKIVVPEVPDTGGISGMISEITSSSILPAVMICAGLSLIAMAFKFKKGARK